jgi:hypothetical protein
MAKEDVETLSTGNYTIELSKGSTQIYKTDNGVREWIAATTDPDRAMTIVEGLILVEHKRFYHPEATPQLTVENKISAVPSFLKRE